MSNFEYLFKNRGALKSQEQRREELLLYLKRRRTDAVDQKRNITDLFDDDDLANENNEQMELEHNHKIWRDRYKPFYNKLMLSEWFKDIPHDMEQNWLVKLCPNGSRNLVVAAYNITISYTRLGVEKCRFESYLPGGGNTLTVNDKFTVLDCIYDRKQECYYVLDVLAWNSLSVKKCDADFRFFWLKSKFEENNELQEKSTCNKYPFILVDFFPAELPLFENIFSKPFSLGEGNELAELDGILFYHRKTHYINGLTPLVGWLKAYMLPEILNIPVHESYMHKKPENYISLSHYLECKEKIKMKKTRKKNEFMET